MSCNCLTLKSDIDDQFNIDTVFSLIDSLIVESEDEPPLEIDDALSYLSEMAFKCEN